MPTSVELLVWADVYRFVRRNLPLIGASLAAAAILLNRNQISANFTDGSWSIGAYYAALFDWASIQSAFLFGIYAFVLGRTEPFIRAISETSVFEEMRAHVRRTMYLAIFLTLFSMPLLVSQPGVSPNWGSVGLWAFVALSTFAVFTSLSFLKVVRVFRKIEAMKINR